MGKLHIEKKEDGLRYSYRYRLVKKLTSSNKWFKVTDHYDRQSIYEYAEQEMQYAHTTCWGMAVLEHVDGVWVVDINWLEKYMDNNRHNLTWDKEQ